MSYRAVTTVTGQAVSDRDDANRAVADAIVVAVVADVDASGEGEGEPGESWDRRGAMTGGVGGAK
jgi:hypothetical protein